ncbi:MAG TPA: UDP-3-O-(3-hydroxymyristoyl)glucosamine N-acyltransferase, partial [Bacteroidia bacterium]|nr:UDP-3-O-(3-hydroxymyristoyl)glucosamine N-acyltransferase [Bacteroidia bacterium]
LLQGKVEGNPETWVNKLSKIEQGEAHSLSFLANPKYTPYIYNTAASIVIVSQNFIAEQPISATLVRVPDAAAAFSKLLEMYNTFKQNKTGIEQPVFVDSTASIGEDVYIGAFAYIGKNVTLADGVKVYPHTYIGDDVTIGKNTVIYAGAKIYNGCNIGNKCIIHSSVVIGADGFGFVPNAQGGYDKNPQTGNVVIHDDVEIGANTTIDRATLGSTIIGKGVKLDNLIQIAHNVEIGENTVIAAQTGIAGSTKIGKNCLIGGQVGIVGHITIADGTKVQAQSGISRPVTETNTLLQGSPAYNMSEYKRNYVHFKNFDTIVKRINDLESNK